MPPFQIHGHTHLRDIEMEDYQSFGGGPLILVAVLGGAMIISEFLLGFSAAF